MTELLREIQQSGGSGSYAVDISMISRLQAANQSRCRRAPMEMERPGRLPSG
jgi:hypothetical protein